MADVSERVTNTSQNLIRCCAGGVLHLHPVRGGLHGGHDAQHHGLLPAPGHHIYFSQAQFSILGTWSIYV